MDFQEIRKIAWRTIAEVLGITEPTSALTGASSSKYLAGDGTWKTTPTGTVTSVDVSGGTSGLTTSGGPVTTSGTITIAGTLAAANGGSGIASYAVGDLVYASASTTLSKLADVATGNALISGGVTTAPAWGKVGLSTHISGTLGAANGGTGVANNAASTITVSGNFGTTLTVTGTTGVTLPTSGTLATLAGAEELTTKTLTSSVGKGTWTASGTWTLPAHTLGGTVSGGGNQINNVIIGTTTPLAGSFTTLASSGIATLNTANSAQGTSGNLATNATETIFTPGSGTYLVIIDSTSGDSTVWRGTWFVWAGGAIVITAITTASNTDLVNSAGSIQVKNTNASTVALRWAYLRLR